MTFFHPAGIKVTLRLATPQTLNPSIPQWYKQSKLIGSYIVIVHTQVPGNLVAR